jgi:hypothetical protein
MRVGSVRLDADEDAVEIGDEGGTERGVAELNSRSRAAAGSHRSGTLAGAANSQ